MNHRAAAILAIFVLLFGSLPSVGAGDLEGVAALDAQVAAQQAQVDDALRFRREQGLSEDRALIGGLLRVTGDPRAQVFGTPLTTDETALVVRRGEIQAELQPVRDYGADHESDWGGIWLTYPPGGTLDNAMTVNVNLVADDDATRNAVRSRLPQGVTVEFTVLPTLICGSARHTLHFDPSSIVSSQV